MIKFENVKKEYADGSSRVTVLNDVSFDIAEGEFTVILGPSGAGKSTILNLIGGMETPTSGKITVQGKDICSLNDRQLTDYRAETIGFVFQFYNLIPNLNVIENVRFGSEIKSDCLDSMETLKKVGLEKRAKAFPSTLSGGEQQRTSIARAIAKKPVVLLCDEPTGALDYNTGKSILKVIEKLNHEMGITVVMVTHNEVIADMADRVISVHAGKVRDNRCNTSKVPAEKLEW